jgi:hypothetical protein
MANEKKIPEKIRFVYEKARHHRTFHADGAWASTTPQGEIQFAFFNDLRPLPAFTVSAISKEGTVGAELERSVNPEDVLREANVTVVMSRDSLKGLIELLSNIIRKMEETEKEFDDLRAKQAENNQSKA